MSQQSTFAPNLRWPCLGNILLPSHSYCTQCHPFKATLPRYHFMMCFFSVFAFFLFVFLCAVRFTPGLHNVGMIFNCLYDVLGLGFHTLAFKKLRQFYQKAAHGLRSAIVGSLSTSVPTTTCYCFMLSVMMLMLSRNCYLEARCFRRKSTARSAVAFHCKRVTELILISTAVDVSRVSSIVFRWWHCVWKRRVCVYPPVHPASVSATLGLGLGVCSMYLLRIVTSCVTMISCGSLQYFHIGDVLRSMQRIPLGRPSLYRPC